MCRCFAYEYGSDEIVSRVLVVCMHCFLPFLSLLRLCQYDFLRRCEEKVGNRGKFLFFDDIFLKLKMHHVSRLPESLSVMLPCTQSTISPYIFPAHPLIFLHTPPVVADAMPLQHVQRWSAHWLNPGVSGASGEVCVCVCVCVNTVSRGWALVYAFAFVCRYFKDKLLVGKLSGGQTHLM